MKRATGWAGIARMGGVGDNLVAASTLRPLKRLGYMTEVITSDHAGPVYFNNPFVDKLTIKKDGEIPGGSDWQKWFVARAKEYDVFAHFSHTIEVRHALFPDQTPFWWPPAYRRKFCAGSYLETVHDIIGVPHEFGPTYFPTEEEVARAEFTRNEPSPKGMNGQRYIGWVISGSRIDKVYPYAAMVIGRIIRELDLSVVMIGVGGKQFEMAKAISEHVPRQNGDTKRLHLALAPDFADPGGEQDWTLRRTLAQAFRSEVVVTPDTGVAWAVSMEPMPKVVLMSHASVENITQHWRNSIVLHADRFAVPCWPCHRLHNDISTCVPNKDGGHASLCISDISAELIITAIRAALGSGSAYDHLMKEWPTRVTLQNFQKGNAEART